MAIVKIGEYKEGKFKSAGSYTLPFPSKPDAVQEVAIGGSSVQSSAFAADTRFIIVTSTENCLIAIGENPTAAAAGGIPLPAWTQRPFLVKPGDKLAVRNWAEPA